MMKFVLFEKIKSENLSEVKKFYKVQFYPLLTSTHCKDTKQKNEKFNMIMLNPNLMRKHNFMLKYEEYFQNFLLILQRKLKKFIGIPGENEDISNEFNSDLENEINEEGNNLSINFDRKISFGKNYEDIKVDPMIDRSSNFYMNKKEYIPKARKSNNSLKDKIPLLKNFNPPYTKRANIDKKIIRNFRNFLKSKYYEYGESYFNIFWTKFIKENLVPPMKLFDYDMKISVEYKSINTKYLVWLFGKEGACDFYEEFLIKEGKNLLNSLKTHYDLYSEIENSIISIELEKLETYVYKMAEVFYFYGKENSDIYDSDLKFFHEDCNLNSLKNSETQSICEKNLESSGAAPSNHLDSQSLLENYIGQNFDIRIEKDDIFKLHNNKLKLFRNRKNTQKKAEDESPNSSLERSRKLDLNYGYQMNSYSGSSEE